MNTKKIISLILGMAILMTGCSSGEDTMYIATAGDLQVPSGVYIYSLMSSTYNAATKVVDPTSDILSQTIDGVPVEEWISEDALKSVKAYIAVEEEFARIEGTLSLEDGEAIATDVNDIWDSNSDYYESNGISKETIEKVVTNETKTQYVYDAYYGENAEKSATDEEIKAYYDENYARVNQLLIEKRTVTEEGDSIPLTGEALMTVKDMSGDYYDRLVAGENFNELMLEFNTWKATQEGEEYVPDFEIEDEFAHDLIINRNQMYFEPDYLQHIFLTDVGGYGIYEHNDYYIVFARQDLHEDSADFEERKGDLNYVVAGEGFFDELLEYADSIEININVDAMDRYTAKDLNI